MKGTFNFSRRFDNGLKFGFYFTKRMLHLNSLEKVHLIKEYTSIPLPGLNSSKTNFNWKPLTKDPGQKLNLNRRILM